MSNYSGFVSYNSNVGPIKNKVPVIKQDADLTVVDSPVEIDQLTGAMSGMNLDFEVVSTNAYTITTADTGKAKLFTFAGTVTVTIPDAAATDLLNVSLYAASGTTVNLSKATGGNTLLGATSLASTESARLVLRSNTTVYELQPLFQTAGPGAGTVTSVTSANADLTVANTTTTPVITLASVGGVSAANVAAGANLANAATDADTPSAIVKRDANGASTLSKLNLTSGANASVGTATLVGGTVTVNTTAVTASSVILLTRQSIGATGAAALGELTIGTVTAGTSFVINAVQAADATALQATDVSVVGYVIIN